MNITFFQACYSLTYFIILVIVHILRISHTKKSNVNTGEIEITLKVRTMQDKR